MPTADVPLSLFGGLDTELSPPDLPEGISPDCEDVIFLPGSVSSRPGLHKAYPAISGNPTLTYLKTYLQPNGSPLNLFLDSAGTFWKEDVTANPGALVQIGTVVSGSYAKSVTAFGREYIAVSDGEHGTDVPRQYDGTNFDRVTQDGPGAGPTFQNYLPAQATVSASGAGTGIAVTSATPTDPVTYSYQPYQPNPYLPPPPTEYITVYTTLTIVTATAHGLAVSDIVGYAGSSYAADDFPSAGVLTVVDSTTIKVGWNSSDGTAGTGGTLTPTNPSLVRENNTVTATTAAAHGFQVGSQVIISGEANTSIVSISAVSRDGVGTCTVTTSAAHGIPVGATIALSGVTDNSFDGTFVVATVPTSTTFTVAMGGAAASSSSGNVQDVWNGTFVITAVPTTTTFSYSQTGPNNNTDGSGTAAIQGYVSAGVHKCVMMFLTRQGYITAPCQPITFDANGGQQIRVSGIPIGPSNVTARILAFTAAGGDNYFYLPAAATSGGTSTVIPDNSTTDAIIDFPDNSLLAATGIDIPGNNLFAQVVLGPCLGFFSYGSRLVAWGERNKVQNLVNMGFDGGYLASAPNSVLGWTIAASGGALTSGLADFGFGWEITGPGTGMITQPAYQDAYGVKILQPSTQYSFRCWCKASAVSLAGSLIAELYSPTGGSLATATIAASLATTGGIFLEAKFNAKTPDAIPSDTLLRIYASGLASGKTLTIDEGEVIYTDDPYFQPARFSYVNNPEAFDGVTGVLGPAGDPSPIRCCTNIRGTMYLHTGRESHSTNQSGSLEPSNWTVNKVSGAVGCVSAFGVDSGRTGTEDSGEEFDLIADRGGLYIFAGGEVTKISQEIQSLWDTINWAAKKTVWVKDDVYARRVYVGIPTGTATAPNLILVLDRRELETAAQIASASPVHITLSGTMRSSDLTRKWTKWNVSMNCGEMLAAVDSAVRFMLGAGNGVTPGSEPGYGNAYYLDAEKLTDDDYGQISPYYCTYFFVSHEAEEQLGLGPFLKIGAYLSAFISGTGTISATPLVDTLANAKTATAPRTLSTSPTADLYWGVNVRGERISIKFASAPLSGQTDNTFTLQKMVFTMRTDPMSTIRGAA